MIDPSNLIDHPGSKIQPQTGENGCGYALAPVCVPGHMVGLEFIYLYVKVVVGRWSFICSMVPAFVPRHLGGLRTIELCMKVVVGRRSLHASLYILVLCRSPCCTVIGM